MTISSLSSPLRNLFSKGFLILPTFANYVRSIIISANSRLAFLENKQVLQLLWYAKHIGIKAVFFYLLLLFHSYTTIIL